MSHDVADETQRRQAEEEARKDNSLRLGVLASGSGTNLQAILDAIGAGQLPARVVCVLSDKEDAYALQRAERAGVPHHVLRPVDYPSREEHDRAMVAQLLRYDVQLVVLAGYLRIVGQPFLSAFPQRIINLHPSLLPSFPGLEAQKQAWEYGVKVSGCTVHFVDEGLDTGPIIVQECVPIPPDCTFEQFTERLRRAEHKLLPLAIKLIAEGRVRVEGRRVTIKGGLQ